MERRPKPRKDEHKTAETTERKSPQMAAEGIVSEGETSAGVLAAALKEFREIIGSVKQELISQMSELRNSIQGSIDTLTMSVSSMQGRITTAEQRISDVEDAVSGSERSLDLIKKENEVLRNKLEYIENYNRRNNIRLIGLSEGVEGRDTVEFFKTWLPSVLGEENFGAPIVIERAHRVPAVRVPGKAPRPILIRLLRFQDRESILRIARDKAPISIDGKRVSFFPDFSSDVMTRRRGMIPALKALKKNVNCHLVYPARIRILTEDGGTRFCHTSDEALKFLSERD